MVEGDEPPGFRDEHPRAAHVLGPASVLVALVLVILTTILITREDTESERRPTTLPGQAASATQTPGPSPTRIGPGRPATFRGESSEVVGPLTFVPASYHLTWSARATRGRCFFALAVGESGASPEALTPVIQVPIGATVSGSGETTLAGGPYELRVTGLRCQWKLHISWSSLPSPTPSESFRPGRPGDAGR
jgi:hypothetical protein